MNKTFFHLQKARNRNGFSILELIVAMAILALLVTLVAIRMSNVQQEGRDTKRIADITQVEKALLTYKENNEAFPKPAVDYGDGGAAEGCGGWDTTSFDANGDGYYWLDILRQDQLINSLPVDPHTNFGDCAGPNYQYYLFNPGTYGCDAAMGEYYVLGITNMEGNPGDYSPSPGFSCPGHDFQTDFEWVTGGFTN